MANYFLIFFILLKIKYDISISINKINNIKNFFANQRNNKEDKIKRIERSIIKNKKFKWDFPIDYFISKKLGENIIKEAIKVIEDETCATFNESTRHIRKKNGINFKYDNNTCSSYEGKLKQVKPQSIFLDSSCKNHLGAVLHEMGHALGLYHEQSRRDRNHFVRIIRRNIEKDLRFNFALNPIHNSQNFGISYDLSSIMHYFMYAFSKNQLATVVPIDQNYNYTIGQENGYTFNDIKLINYLYCNDTCYNKTSLNCQNYGYPDPKNCSRCKCPHGYAGTECNILQPQSDRGKCGTHYFNATSTVLTLNKTGIMNCTFHIKSISGVNISITVDKLISNYPPDISKFLLCFSKMALEIKHKIDKSVTGLCLCGVINKPINISSEGDEVIILWYGKNNNHTFTINYKEVNSTII